MFGRRKSHPNYKKPIKLKYRPSPALVAAVVIAAAAVAGIVCILVFNNGKDKGGRNTAEEGKVQDTDVIAQDTETTAEEDYSNEAKKAAQGFMSEFCILSFEGMSEYCNKDIAGMIGCRNFEEYIDEIFMENAGDPAEERFYGEIADIIVDCAKSNISSKVNDCSKNGDNYVVAVTLDYPEFWSGALEQLSGESKASVNEKVVRENEAELKKITDDYERKSFLTEKIYDETARNIRKVCKEPETGSVDGELTVIMKNGRWVVDADNSDMKVFINPLIGA